MNNQSIKLYDYYLGFFFAWVATCALLVRFTCGTKVNVFSLGWLGALVKGDSSEAVLDFVFIMATESLALISPVCGALNTKMSSLESAPWMKIEV